MARGAHNRGSSNCKQRNGNRRSTQSRANKRFVKARTEYARGIKENLSVGLLNVDGLSASTLDDVANAASSKSLDLIFLLETKRRFEEVDGLVTAMDISIPGYKVKEVNRSDAAHDKMGGGIAVYKRQCEGLLFDILMPSITDPNLHYVKNERVWVTTHSLKMKTAICTAYLGYQSDDDKHKEWNEGILHVLLMEAASLRSQGYRVVFMGDFNSRVGSAPGQGIVGNTPDITKNGERFIAFLNGGNFTHINGQSDLTTGLWTRQRANSRSVLDYAIISNEHLHTVKSLIIDDHGIFGGGSDHNFLFLSLKDEFVKKKRLAVETAKKKKWNYIDDNFDWNPFQQYITSKLSEKSTDLLDIDELANNIYMSLYSAGVNCVGFRKPASNKKSTTLPAYLVDKLRLKRSLEKVWKSNLHDTSVTAEQLTTAETSFLNQKSRVNDLLFAYRNRNRAKIKELCSGNTVRARRSFWSLVSTKVKQSSCIDAVVEHGSGELKCGLDEITSEVGDHLCRVFNGSFEPPDIENIETTDPGQHIPNSDQRDHGYASSSGLKLPKRDCSGSLVNDPEGWSNRQFKFDEVKAVLSGLSSGKSPGWDTIPNEFLKNSPDVLVKWLVVLFNKIKTEKSTPKG